MTIQFKTGKENFEVSRYSIDSAAWPAGTIKQIKVEIMNMLEHSFMIFQWLHLPSSI